MIFAWSHQVIALYNPMLSYLLIALLETNVRQIIITLRKNIRKKMQLEMSLAEWRHFFLILDVLTNELVNNVNIGQCRFLCWSYNLIWNNTDDHDFQVEQGPRSL